MVIVPKTRQLKYYARAENLLGISGKAGNLRGTRISGGNIFEGWRSAEYPTPTILAQTLRTADALLTHYLPSPGPLL